MRTDFSYDYVGVHRRRVIAVLYAAGLALLVGACGQMAPPEVVGRHDDAIDSVNGLSLNGMSTNGMSTNGMSTNGLSTNGLSTNGLSTNGFNAWWNSSGEDTAAMVMKYLTKCAVPWGQFRTFAAPSGISYTWPGVLGLAPGWAAGQPMTTQEQQLVSACMATHTNKFGVHVPISVRGYFVDGSAIPLDQGEDAEYSVKEGCFFGNMFNGEGLFAGYEDNPMSSAATGATSPRACAAHGGKPGACTPIVQVGKCSQICHFGTADPTAYDSCTWHGKVYKSINTHMRLAEVYQCGDGICQFTESPYSTSAHTGCADCGIVP